MITLLALGMPMAEVMMLPVAYEPIEVAAKMDNSGDQQRDAQLAVASTEYCSQLIPFELIIIRFVPLPATATNKESSGDQHTEYHQ